MGEPSRRTPISAALHQSGLYGRVVRQKSLISERHKTARLKFAKRHLKTLWPWVLWGCFSAAGTGRLVRIEGKMNRAKYKEILDETLLQTTQDLRLGWRFIFQQDNNPRHTAKTTQEWFRNKSLNVLEWPSQSPDLNPIEHLWRDLKMAVQWCSPSNLTELEGICREEWETLPKYRCAKLVASYPRRLKALITATGAFTRCWVKGLNFSPRHF